MPDDLDEIRQRLGAVENQLASEASLRAMMDLDQATLTTRLDAQDNLLRALSITQSDHTARLRDHTARLHRLEQGQTRLEQGQASLEQGQTRLEGTVGRVAVGVDAILGLLQDEHPGDDSSH